MPVITSVRKWLKSDWREQSDFKVPFHSWYYSQKFAVLKSAFWAACLNYYVMRIYITTKCLTCCDILFTLTNWPVWNCLGFANLYTYNELEPGTGPMALERTLPFYLTIKDGTEWTRSHAHQYCNQDKYTTMNLLHLFTPITFYNYNVQKLLKFWIFYNICSNWLPCLVMHAQISLYHMFVATLCNTPTLILCFYVKNSRVLLVTLYIKMKLRLIFEKTRSRFSIPSLSTNYRNNALGAFLHQAPYDRIVGHCFKSGLIQGVP